MKVFTFIMSFFLLYLSCLPCNDSKECNVKEEQNISAAASHQQHNHDEEACTPFCTCSCCAASAFYSAISKTQVAKVVFQSEKYPLYNIDINTAVTCNVWQPPKIA